MSRDDLRLDIKFMMANNLIEIINLRDKKNVCSRELSLAVDYEIYDKLIEKLKKLYICQIELTQDLIICKVNEVKEVH